MRIVIDATPLLLRSAGVKTHVYQWVTHLRRLAGESVIGAFPWIGSLGPLDHERSVLSVPGTAVRLGLLAAVNYSGLPIMNWLPMGAGGTELSAYP